jgi:ATP-dependent helicase/nuclease subunit A
VRTALGELDALRRRELGRLAHLVISNLLSRLALEAAAAAASRRTAGTLRFHDLLVLTRDLLRDRPEIRRAVRARYRRILVDEFQDTDPLQLQIVLLLGAATPGSPPEPGRLFFVGDPKQSIYRFRGADASLYGEAREALVGGEPTRLASNFRSVPGVLSFVNGVFSSLIDDESRPGETVADYVPLEPVRLPQGEHPPVVVLGGPSKERASAAERRELEAGEIAATITLALREGWPVHDGAGLRPARPSDIAVLVPRRTGLFALESAFAKWAIAYRVASSTLIYGSDEVRDLRAALAAIGAGADERAVVAALRTPAFACSDGEILRYRLAGGALRLDAAVPPGMEESPVPTALRGLWRLHEEQYRLGVLGVLEQLLVEHHLLALQAGTSHRREALRRVDFVLDRARAFTESGGEGVAGFISFLDLEAQLAVRGIELPRSGEEEQAVTILTVHGAKGLEFPIVVLAELGGPPSSRRGPTLLLPRDAAPQARIRSGVETDGYLAAAREEDEAEAREAIRLAYVGATRARDHLVVSLFHHPAKTDRARSLAELLHGAWIASGATARRVELPAEAEAVGPRGQEQARRRLEAVNLDAWREAREALLAAISRRRSVAATGLAAQHWTPPRSVSPAEDPPEEASWRRPRAATNVGRAVHAVLQQVDPALAGELGALSRAAAIEEGCQGEEALVEELVHTALRSAVVQRAVASGRYYRELPLSVAIGGGVLEAVVDLCFEDGGELVVVDYKTDALRSAREVEEVAARYTSQAGAYALALEAVTGRAVSSVVLVFLALAEGAVEYEVPDLPSAIEHARALAEQALAPA